MARFGRRIISFLFAVSMLFSNMGGLSYYAAAEKGSIYLRKELTDHDGKKWEITVTYGDEQEKDGTHVFPSNAELNVVELTAPDPDEADEDSEDADALRDDISAETDGAAESAADAAETETDSVTENANDPDADAERQQDDYEFTYEEYVDKATEKLECEPDDFTTAYVFDISIRDTLTGEDFIPDGSLVVSARLVEDEFEKSDRVGVVHFGEEPEILESAMNEKTVEFETDGFSVFVLMQITREVVLTSSDGDEYLVSVTYDKASGIPADAELSVTQIREDDPEFADYSERSAAAQGGIAEDFDLIRVFDITLRDPETGEELQPDGEVRVNVRLLSDDLNAYENVGVVHLSGSGAEGDESLTADVSDGSVGFGTTGFSVYVIVASGTGSETEINGSLTDAIQAAADGDTIRLTENCSVASWADITNGRAISLTFDLDGHTLTVGEGGLISYNAGSLTFINGTITTSETELKIHKNNGVITLGNRLTVTASALNIPSYADGAVIIDGAAVDCPVSVSAGADLTVSAGSVGAVSVGNGAYFTVSGGSVGAVTVGDGAHVTVSGGRVDGSVSLGSGSELGMTDGTIDGGVSTEYGYVNISGGTVDGDVDLGDYGHLDMTGGTVTGDVNSSNSSNVNISGGHVGDPTTVTITAHSASREYDGTELSDAGYDVSGLPSGYTVEGLAVSGALTDAGTCENVISGTAVIKDGGGTDATAGFNVVLINGTLEVTPKTVTVSGAVTANGKVYDGETETTLNATLDGIISADADEAKLIGVFSDANVGVGKTVTPVFTGAGTGNYSIDLSSVGTLTADITQRPVTVKADDKTKGHAEPDPTLTATITGIIGGDTVEFSLSREPGDDFGMYLIIPSGDESQGNYTVSFETGVLTIKKIDVTVTVSGQSSTLVYDGEEHTVSGFNVSADNGTFPLESVSFTGSGTPTVSRTDAGTSYMGLTEADFEIDPALTGEYNITLVVTDGFQTVEKAPVTLTAISKVVNYDGTDHFASGFASSVDGLTFEGVSASTGTHSAKGTYAMTFVGVEPGVTVDSTGNYVVTEAVDGELIIAELFQKRIAKFEGNIASYELTVNPAAVRLNGGAPLKLQDTFTSNQSIIYSTVSVSPNDGVSFDYSGYTGTFMIPDQTTVTITYDARVLADAGENLTVGNTALFASTTSRVFEGSVNVSEARTVAPAGSDIAGQDGVYKIRIFTYPEGHMEKGLSGAEFLLLDYNQKPVEYKAGPNAGSEVTFTTGADGYVTVTLNEAEDGVSIHKNTVYYLEMIKVPVSDNGDGTYTYYQKDNTLYSFLIANNPSYSYGESGIYTYFNDDVLKVRCYKESVGINVTTRFIGNFNLTGEQKNGIVFVLEKENLVTGEWDEIERHSYAEFSWGSMQFNTGKNGWSVQDYGSTFRIREIENEVEGAEVRTTCVVSSQSKGVTTSDETNEFLVDPDNEAYSFSLIFTNQYFNHKLTFYALDEMSGDFIPGTKITAYRVSDGAQIAVYTTGEGGTTDIVRTDAYATDTLYYAVQTDAASGYLMPDDPVRSYFYFSEHNMLVPAGLPAGESALDLSESFSTVVISNSKSELNIPVIVTWGLSGIGNWPDSAVDHVLIELFRSVDGGEAEKVDGKEVVLDPDTVFDNSVFRDLPLRDGDHVVSYTLKETIFADAAGTQDVTKDYAVSETVSGTGWHVIRNQEAVSVRVTKEWYEIDGTTLATDLSGKPSVTFSLYRTKGEVPETVSTREEIEALIGSSVLVKSGLTLSAENGWETTVWSLPATYGEGDHYLYFALEDEASMPDNHKDSYLFTRNTAGTSDLGTLTIRNTRTPVTVIVQATDAQKEYGEADPAFGFTVSVQEDGTTAVCNPTSTPGEYEVVVTSGSDVRTLHFTLNREEGENVGNYSLTPSGLPEQEGYRVLYRLGTLSIGRADVTVTAGASKTYGDADPALVAVTGMKNGEDPSVIRYEIYREPGEDAGEYEIWVNGESIQGNYNVTFVEGVLTVGRASVIVKAVRQTKVYGDYDPELTVSMLGLKAEDAEGVIDYSITRDLGENAGDYDIILTGDPVQGNYTVEYMNGLFTIEPAPLTVSVTDEEKTYGDPDPEEWEIIIDGLQRTDGNNTHTAVRNGYTVTYTYTLPEGKTIEFDVSRSDSESVGEYTVTPSGTESQGNYDITFEIGALYIRRAVLTVRADDVVKGKNEDEDPMLSATVEGWKFSHASDAVPTSTKVGDVVTCVYELDGATLVTFTLTRAPGDAEGDYTITPAGEVYQGNYEITYETGTFSILSIFDIDVRQETDDPVDPTADPGYLYYADVDLRGTGIRSLPGYFETDTKGVWRKEIALPGAGTDPDLETLKIPAGAKLTVTQVSAANPVIETNYETEVTLDGDVYIDVGGENKCAIDTVDNYYAVKFIHSRICLPVTAMAGVIKDEEGASAVTPSGSVGIPDGIMTVNAALAEAVEIAVGYELPTDKYYQFNHGALFGEGGSRISDVNAVRYAADTKTWQFRDTADGEFSDIPEGAGLRLYYYPVYVCKIDDVKFYTLNAALNHMTENAMSSATIEMLLSDFIMPASDKLTVPSGKTVTITTAATEFEGMPGTDAMISRNRSLTGNMFAVSGTLIFKNIILDGNKGSVTGAGAMVTSSGTLTLGENVTLQNASGVNGGAINVTGGTLTVSDGATISGNNATYGGAIYATGGTINIEGGAISSNTAAEGGALFMTGGKVTLSDGVVSSNEATSGGAFYLEGGTLTVSGGTVSGNAAESDGGMLYATGGTVNVTGGTISSNAAENGNGGAICYVGPDTVMISGGTVVRNTASNYGGAIYQSSGTVTLSGKIGGTAIGDANTAKNGAAVYVAAGITNFEGCSVVFNKATIVDGGAVGVDASARLYFSGKTAVKDNKNSAGKNRNVYLDENSDEIINTPGLESGSSIGVYAVAGILDDQGYDRGDACGKFGTYTATNNLSGFKNDRNTGLTAYSNNFKIIWSKVIKVNVRVLSTAGVLPPTTSNLALDKTYNFYPTSQSYDIYDLAMIVYNNNSKVDIDKLAGGPYLYAYTFAKGTDEFSNFVTEVRWNSSAQRWDIYRNGAEEVYSKDLIVYYAKGSYISIVNNSETQTLTVDPFTIMGKNIVADSYGYVTARDFITLDTLVPIRASDLVLAPGKSVKLLFPGAVNENWTLNGVFADYGNQYIRYTLDRTHGGTEKTIQTGDEGQFTLSGKTRNVVGDSYEILFYDPVNICKVVDGTGEHPFYMLTDAWQYILDNNIETTFDYLSEDGVTTVTKTMPGGTIEMILDYLQPLNDVLTIGDGYYLRLTTAANSGTMYNYSGKDPEKATISRDSDNDGAGVIINAAISEALRADACNSFLFVDNMIFDGKALAKKGNGGAVTTINTVVGIEDCEFKGYQAMRGGAIFTMWGGITVKNCNFSNCVTGDTNDKTGGGAIWSTAKLMTVENCSFNHCACESGKSQGGAVFHNICGDGKAVYNNAPSQYSKFKNSYYVGTKTVLKNCTFKDCYAFGGSGGTMESDAQQIYLIDCSFDGSYSNKDNANGGAVNILHNDAYNGQDEYTPLSGSVLSVENCSFNNCYTNKKGSNGGAIKASNTETIRIYGSTFTNTSSFKGGALKLTGKGATVEILGSTFTNCTGNTTAGAVYARSKTLTVGDYVYDDNGTTVTKHTSFVNCTSPQYGGIFQDQNTTGSSVTVENAVFTDCSSTNDKGGALYAAALSLTVNGSEFTDCRASGHGGAIYHEGSSEALTNDVFSGCTSDKNGGAAYFANGSLSVSGTTVTGCRAVNNGGGLYISPTSSTFENCDFSDNWVSASDGKGGSLFINQNTSTINGGTVSGSRAAYGGGIYQNGSNQASPVLNVNGTAISNCSATLAGGALYHRSGANVYGSITGCYALRGGGIYSVGNLYFADADNAMTVSGCYAKTVTLGADGSVSIADDFVPDNQGGGVYNASNIFTQSSSAAVITDCHAYDGGGIYLYQGTLNLNGGSVSANDAYSRGGGVYDGGGTFNFAGAGATSDVSVCDNTADAGAGLFVAEGKTAMIGNYARVTGNHARTEGGGIAVGGSASRLYFMDYVTVKDNTQGDLAEVCNVYLDQDTNGVIRTNGALNSSSYIGVYASDDQDDAHGKPGRPFGTHSQTYGNLGRFFNDRRQYYYGVKGTKDNQIIWVEFVCKITDASGNLLYKDEACTVPATFPVLGNDGNDSAFGRLENHSASNALLYNSTGAYFGGYQVQMLIQDYPTDKQAKLTGGRVVTLTTASTDPDECGFKYESDPKHPYATVTRAKNGFSMISTDSGASLTILSLIIDGGSTNGFTYTANGAIALVNNSTFTVGENATLRNSATTKNGGGVRVEGGGTLNLGVGGTISGCSGDYGGGVSVKLGVFNMTGGTITGCSARYGGAVRMDRTMNMSGGVITGNSATADGGGISLDVSSSSVSKVNFSGDPKVTGNTLNGEACNVEIAKDSNALINTSGLGLDASIGIYVPGNETEGTLYWNHGMENKPFGTRTGDACLYNFINDRNGLCGGKVKDSDPLIYWLGRPLIDVYKTVESDWSYDKTVEFSFTVQLDLGGATNDELVGYGFTNTGTATFTLTDGGYRSLSLPTSLINTDYTVTENLVGEDDYTTTVRKDDNPAEAGRTVTGKLGENIDGSSGSTSTSELYFTNTRVKGDISISKTVESKYPEDFDKSFNYIVTLDDSLITKDYSCSVNGTPGTLSFTNGVATVTLKHGQSVTVYGLPVKLPYTVYEDLSIADQKLFRVRVSKNGADSVPVEGEIPGKVGELLTCAFINNKLEIVCKITNQYRDLLYYKDTGELVPAVYFRLEDAFAQVNSGGLRTSADGTASGTLRIEMVVSEYTMEAGATLTAGKNVILSTALTTDDADEYPYNMGVDDGNGNIATVFRGFNGTSMINNAGTLTVDRIILDGGSENGFSSADSGGVIQVGGSGSRLTLNTDAVLCNSSTEGNGGAIWTGAGSQLFMNGEIENCSADGDGGGIYSGSGFSSVSVGGSVKDCTATGNGGAICATRQDGVNSRLTLRSDADPDASLEGNSATYGGAVWSGVTVTVQNYTIKDNTATVDGGGIYMSDEAPLTMTSGSIEGNIAENGSGGGLVASGSTQVRGGSFTGNEAPNGFGGAILVSETADVTIRGNTTSFTENSAAYGGVVSNRGTLTVADGSMTSNEASVGGSAIYVEDGKALNMTGGTISGNVSPMGAVYSGSDAEFNFSGNAVVAGNTYTDGTTKMDVYLGYDSDAVINTTGLGSKASIGIYVADGETVVPGEDYPIYYKHGIADRFFGTYYGTNPEYAGLGHFFNDRDDELFGMDGELIDQNVPGEYYIMWPGKNLYIDVRRFDVQVNGLGEPEKDAEGGYVPVADPEVVTGAEFALVNITTGEEVWSGTSNSSGIVTIPWSKIEASGGNTALFKENSTYWLYETRTGEGCVLPAGSWTLNVIRGNFVEWTTNLPAETNVNRTLDIGPATGGELGDTFRLYNDRIPKVIFNANGGTLNNAGKAEPETVKAENVSFTDTQTEASDYTIKELNPVWYTKFLNWETDSGTTYVYDDTITFYRRSDFDDLLLYAQWVPVVCKITDRDDRLLYINGEPAIYATLQDAFSDFNTRSFTLTPSGGKATQRKIKMLVGEYDLTVPVELARSKAAILTTASPSDTDGYPARDGVTTCVITRAFDTGESMITNKNQLALLNITLDGAGDTMTADGGIVEVEMDYAILYVATGVTLRNSAVSGNGGAIRAGEKTTVNVSDGLITGCYASAYGSGIFLDPGAELILSGGKISNCAAAAGGAAIYLSEGSLLDISGGPVFENNTVLMPGYEGKENGGDDTAYAGDLTRQDIFIAGYEGTDGERNAASMMVTGAITSGAGTIWVWAEKEPHFKSEQQFALIKDGLNVSDETYQTFRNARDDEATENGTGDYLYGTPEGDAAGFVYWGGNSEGTQVILKKIIDDTFGPLSGAKLTVYRGNSANPFNARLEDGTKQELKDLESGSSGVFWIGTLPYGTYYLHETVYPSNREVKQTPQGWWYELTVSDTGVTCSEKMNARP